MSAATVAAPALRPHVGFAIDELLILIVEINNASSGSIEDWLQCAHNAAAKAARTTDKGGTARGYALRSAANALIAIASIDAMHARLAAAVPGRS